MEGLIATRNYFTYDRVCSIRDRFPAGHIYSAPRGSVLDSPEFLEIRLALGIRNVTPKGCWEWSRSTTVGYGAININGRIRLCHRVAFWVANECTIGEDLCICHTCDNRPCINPDHLFLGTKADNLLDCWQKKRRTYNRNSSNVRFDWDEIEKIRREAPEAKSLRAYAREVGIPYPTIQCITSERTWKKTKQ